MKLEYELLITTSARIVTDKKKILTRLLAKEKDKLYSLVDLDSYNFVEDKETGDINKSFISITDNIFDFSEAVNIKDPTFQRIKSKLTHVLNCIYRLKTFLSWLGRLYMKISLI